MVLEVKSLKMSPQVMRSHMVLRYEVPFWIAMNSFPVLLLNCGLYR